MIKRKFQIFASIAMFSMNASAAVLTYSGQFETTLGSGLPAGVPALLSGEFQFSFEEDHPTFSSIGESATFDVWENHELSVFSITPSTIGETSFTVADVRVQIVYLNGAPLEISIGGIADGSSGSVSREGFDDFFVSYDFSTHEYTSHLVTQNTSAFYRGSHSSGSLALVPEPNAFLLCGFGVALTAFRRTRSNWRTRRHS